MTNSKWAKYATPDGGAWTYSAPNVRGWITLTDLMRANKDNGGHFFDASTLRFFGSRNRELVRGVLVELQTRTPDGMGRYAVVPFDDEGRDMGIVCRHTTRNAARKCARQIATEGLHVVEGE